MSIIQDMKNLKVRDKLFLTFGGGIFLFLLLASVSYYLINKTRDYGDTVYTAHLNISQSVYELKSGLYAVRNSLITMLLEDDKTKLPLHHKKISEFTKSIDMGIEEILQKTLLDAKAVPILAELKNVWEAFRDTRDKELIPHILAGRYKDAKALAYGIQAERFDRFTTLAKEIVQYENLLVNTAKLHVEERIKGYIFSISCNICRCIGWFSCHVFNIPRDWHKAYRCYEYSKIYGWGRPFKKGSC